MKKGFLIFFPIFFILLAIIFYLIFIEKVNDDILDNARQFFLGFVLVNITSLFYFIYICYLRKKGTVRTMAIFLSAPPFVVFIVLTIIFALGYGIVTFGRIRHLDLGSELFRPCAYFESELYASFWSTDYWLSDKSYYKKYHNKEITRIQGHCRGCLIGHLGTELVGYRGFCKDNSDFKEIENFIKRGVPVIVDWFSPKEGSHFSVVVGFEKNKILLADPAFGKIKKYELGWFLKRWSDHGFVAKDYPKNDPGWVNRICVVYK